MANDEVIWQSKRYTRSVLVLVSGGVDSQCVGIILKTKLVQTECLNCVLHSMQPIQRLQLELINTLSAYNWKPYVITCCEQFRWFVKLLARRERSRTQVAPCIRCNTYLKSNVCLTLSAVTSSATGHYIRVTITSGARAAVDSVNQLKSQLYFVRANTQTLYPLGLLYKADVLRLHNKFESDFGQSNDLCFKRYARLSAGAGGFGCGTSRDSLRSEKCSHAVCGAHSRSDKAYIKTSSQSQAARAIIMLNANVSMLRTNRKLYTGQRVCVLKTSNRNHAVTSDLFVLTHQFGALLKSLRLN